MKRLSNILLLTSVVLSVVLPVGAAAQDGVKEKNGTFMPYIVEGKDTVYLSPLEAARVYEKKKRQKGREWRKYYRLVYNFAKVYPYAIVAKDLVLQTDSTIKAENLKYVRKDRYVEAITKDLFHTFEKPLSNLTVTQGQLLMKLIDRECGILPYDIIHDFKNRYAAGFWQGIARLFGNDLKKHYDPLGDDAATEELVRQWENGTFEQTYYEIFWKYPPMVDVPEKYRKQGMNTPHAERDIANMMQKTQKQSRASSSKKK